MITDYSRTPGEPMEATMNPEALLTRLANDADEVLHAAEHMLHVLADSDEPPSSAQLTVFRLAGLSEDEVEKERARVKMVKQQLAKVLSSAQLAELQSVADAADQKYRAEAPKLELQIESLQGELRKLAASRSLAATNVEHAKANREQLRRVELLPHFVKREYRSGHSVARGKLTTKLGAARSLLEETKMILEIKDHRMSIAEHIPLRVHLPGVAFYRDDKAEQWVFDREQFDQYRATRKAEVPALEAEIIELEKLIAAETDTSESLRDYYLNQVDGVAPPI
jgi:hypothetical protein